MKLMGDPGGLSAMMLQGVLRLGKLLPRNKPFFQADFCAYFVTCYAGQGRDQGREVCQFQKRGGLRLERSCLYIQNRTLREFMQNYLPQGGQQTSNEV